jgi:glycosyltransferase involved in cell wall biosynthesis
VKTKPVIDSTAEPLALKLSIILPCKNEELGLDELLTRLTAEYAEAEIIVVNDGSTDKTLEICARHPVQVVTHPYSKGNGAAVKSGARHASGDILVFMDADGQHRPEDIAAMLEKLDQGYDMVVGQRTVSSHAGIGRLVANSFYNRFASWMTGQKIGDLTSGFRVVRAEKFKEFLYLLPNGFSYPTTSTMAFFRAGYSVNYHDITALQRRGKSHINPLKDGVRFLLIIFKIGTLYSPLKIFFPFALLQFSLGAGYYAYTFLMYHRFTNMSALLLTSSITVFLMGLVSEQITSLLYSKIGKS